MDDCVAIARTSWVSRRAPPGAAVDDDDDVPVPVVRKRVGAPAGPRRTANADVVARRTTIAVVAAMEGLRAVPYERTSGWS